MPLLRATLGYTHSGLVWLADQLAGCSVLSTLASAPRALGVTLSSALPYFTQVITETSAPISPPPVTSPSHHPSCEQEVAIAREFDAVFLLRRTEASRPLP